MSSPRRALASVSRRIGRGGAGAALTRPVEGASTHRRLVDPLAVAWRADGELRPWVGTFPLRPTDVCSIGVRAGLVVLGLEAPHPATSVVLEGEAADELLERLELAVVASD